MQYLVLSYLYNILPANYQTVATGCFGRDFMGLQGEEIYGVRYSAQGFSSFHDFPLDNDLKGRYTSHIETT